jgi:hypothetical protein
VGSTANAGMGGTLGSGNAGGTSAAGGISSSAGATRTGEVTGGEPADAAVGGASAGVGVSKGPCRPSHSEMHGKSPRRSFPPVFIIPWASDQSDLVVFSIMVEGLRHRAVNSVRGAQVSAVNAMMRYARGTLGPAPAEEAMPLITRTLTGTRPSCRRSSPRRGPENRRH